ncbi:MAG: YegP family protein [Ruminococcus sp.]|nr:YegP family protein [Ruminococcus sp.]
MGKFIIKETKTGFTFSLKAGNGEVIATGGEVYNSLASIKNGIASVAKNAPVANLEDQTVEGFEAQTHPKFEIYKDKAGEFRFRLKARNGEIIAVSEGYVKKDSCKNGIESVRKNAVDAPVIEPEKEAE